MIIFKCPDQNCEICTDYNSKEKWGECKKCLSDYETEDGLTCTSTKYEFYQKLSSFISMSSVIVYSLTSSNSIGNLGPALFIVLNSQ